MGQRGVGWRAKEGGDLLTPTDPPMFSSLAIFALF